MSPENSDHSSPHYQASNGVYNGYHDPLVTIPQEDQINAPTTEYDTLTEVQMVNLTNPPPQVVHADDVRDIPERLPVQGDTTVEEYTTAFINSPWYHTFVSRGDYLMKWVYWSGLKWDIQEVVNPDEIEDTLAMVNRAKAAEWEERRNRMIPATMSYQGEEVPRRRRSARGRGRAGRGRNGAGPSQGGGDDESGPGFQQMVIYF